MSYFKLITFTSTAVTLEMHATLSCSLTLLISPASMFNWLCWVTNIGVLKETLGYRKKFYLDFRTHHVISGAKKNNLKASKSKHSSAKHTCECHQVG